MKFRKHCFFVDLFVRVSNVVATSMYERLGYTVYRTVIDYYSGEKSDEDAYGETFVPVVGFLKTSMFCASSI